MRIAFVVQRYGAEILGGSEYHCRLIAERLAARHDVEVLTTCARDYITWKNEYPEGTDRISGVTRPALRQRAARATSRRSTSYSDWIFSEPAHARRRAEVARDAGPVVLRRCSTICKRHHRSYDALIFFTYLYAPTVLGLEIDPQRIDPGADGARRAGDSPRPLQGDVPAAGGDRLQHRRREELPEDRPSTSARSPKKPSAAAST